ncbi:MAG: multidrug efflux RND transporter permease subunit [Proteobacteria bacterium]|nr:multidrug efflux RND transporter permease subunit [Pseudomonadota bacterium]
MTERLASISAPFVRRPVATTLLTFGVFLAGMIAFFLLPVSPLPQIDIPTIFVSASLPGASPETMATSVATPLERQLGRIAGVTEMTSSSSQGSTRIVLQFELSRDIDGAARDVQAALNAARAQLPSGMPGNPTYRKANPSDQPILVFTMTSKTLDRGQVYDAASTIVAQKIAQVDGVGQVTVGGGSLPAVRVEMNLTALNKYSIALDTVRTALQNANANRPKGFLEADGRHWIIQADDQARKAAQYRDLVVAMRDGRPVRLSDVAEVQDSVEDVRTMGVANGQPAIILQVIKQPNANILQTAQRVQALLPQLRASIPADIEIHTAIERTSTIRASLHNVEATLLIAIALVIGVVFVFLRDGRSTLVPAVAVPVSLVGTFAVMYLCGYSLDNLSLMALTIATGFVVDDAVVVLENITRHLEAGEPRLRAVLLGAREVGFTVLSMSLSLIAVFIPILLMEGIVGRYLRVFSVVLSVAILVSLLVSLTTTPMICAKLLRAREEAAPVRPNAFLRWSERAFEATRSLYERSLHKALAVPGLVMFVLLVTVCLNVYLYVIVPKGLFPTEDTGRLIGGVQTDQSASFQSVSQKVKQLMAIINADPAVDTAVGFVGAGHGFMFIGLKPLAQRKLSTDAVIARLRPKLAGVPGAQMFLFAAQDIRTGGRQSNATYQYTLQSDSLPDLRLWGPKITEALKQVPELEDVNSDQQERGLETAISFDRAAMARLGITTAQVDSTLGDAFGQRQVSTIYNPLNQYHVVMEVAPQFLQNPQTLRDIYVQNKSGKMVPLSAFASFGPGTTPTSVQHQGQFVAVTVSFNLAQGTSLGQAAQGIDAAMARIGVPASIHGSFAGTAATFQQSSGSQPWLILAALLAVYIVLGVLYESYVHPLTILSTLPSAGVGALLALLAFHMEFSLIALIGVLLLVGIVKKNAILMIDFALDAERHRGMGPREAIFTACSLRFRPIMMTTMAAMLGALPLALGFGEGAQMRRPLGVAILGGLAVSQLLTLYTTPVVYLYLDRFRLWARRRWQRQRGEPPASDDHGMTPVSP